MNKIDVFTDGSCLRNPGPAGSASISYFTIDMIKRKLEKKLYLGDATNNIAELTAIDLALDSITKILTDFPALKCNTLITIWTDSQYSIGVIREGKNYVANCDLIDSIKQHFRSVEDKYDIKIDIRWVRGHATSKQNIAVDKLAREAIPEGIRQGNKRKSSINRRNVVNTRSSGKS